MKKTSKAVKESRARAGIKPTSIGFTDEQKDELDAFAAELGLARAAAIIEAIRSYKGQGSITNERLLTELRKRLKGTG